MLKFTLLANVRILHFNSLSIQNSCFDMPENNRLGICSSQMTSNKNFSMNISEWRIRLFKNKQKKIIYDYFYVPKFEVFTLLHLQDCHWNQWGSYWERRVSLNLWEDAEFTFQCCKSSDISEYFNSAPLYLWPRIWFA